MAADVSLNPGEDNDCCRNWKEKYSKLEEKRNALRQAVKLLEIQLNKVQAECATHKKACELERAHAEAEKKEREKLVTVQTELEERICSLELEASSFQQKGCPDAKLEEKVKLLEAKISNGEVEIKNLKELLKKEKSRADLEKKYALSEKKRAADAWKAVEAEKSKADEERRNSVEERKKLEQCQLEVEKLKEEVEGFRSRLAVEAVKYKETCKKHESERHKAMKEKKRADKEKSRADEQRRLADESNRKLIEENAHVVKLREEVEAGKQKLAKLLDEKNRLLGYVNRGLLEEKDRADKFSNDVRMQKLPEHLNRLPLATGLTTTLGTSTARWDNGLSENLLSVPLGETTGNLNFQKEKNSIVMESDSEIMKESRCLEVAQNTRKRVLEESKVGNLSKDLVGKRQRIDGFQHEEQFCQKPANMPVAKSSRSKKAENMKLKLCKEQLKLEKMKSKHAKEVIEFERCRNNILSNEIRQMRFDFGQYSRRLDALDSFVSPNTVAVSEMGKNVRKYMDIMKNNHHGSEPFHPGSLAETELFQSSGRGSSDFVSGQGF
ncbi:hypothetical protein MLD38_039258 [Melastoma candidum]|uniref:Uncharacterized protein n=1 Tax=Melastoma candidum TaxID=119954 RepID=A0ACB9L1I0_9MYRT|nr:hypothetical protein MLD38_039258 [Melastoma candidum]